MVKRNIGAKVKSVVLGVASRFLLVVSFLVVAQIGRADDISDNGNAPPPAVAEAKPVDKKTAKVRQDLDAFCKKWMTFLVQRERDNRKKIDWETGPGGVSGKFVGYSPEYDCTLRDPAQPDAVPVATITYREFIYQQEGTSQTDAAETAPRVMEATEVTEIFRYSKGQWIY